MRRALGIGLSLLSGCQLLSGIDTNLRLADAADGAECGDVRTDPNHCGACGHSCLGRPCTDGVCEPVVPYSGAFFQCFALDDAYLYAQSSTNILRIPRSGMNDLYSGAEPCMDMMPMPDRTLFVTTSLRVRSYTFAPNGMKTYFGAADGGPSPSNLTTDQTRVFFTVGPQLGEVKRATGNSAPLYTHGEDLSALTWDTDRFLFGTVSGDVFALPDGATSATKLGHVAKVVNSIVRWGTSIVVASGVDVTVLGEATSLFEGLTGGTQLALADDALYVLIGGEPGTSTGSLWRVDMRDRTKLLLAKGQDLPFRVFVDGAWVYWSTRGVVGQGRILRVAR